MPEKHVRVCTVTAERAGLHGTAYYIAQSDAVILQAADLFGRLKKFTTADSGRTEEFIVVKLALACLLRVAKNGDDLLIEELSPQEERLHDR